MKNSEVSRAARWEIMRLRLRSLRGADSGGGGEEVLASMAVAETTVSWGLLRGHDGSTIRRETSCGGECTRGTGCRAA